MAEISKQIKLKKLLMFLGLVAVGLALNLTGTNINRYFGLPFYFDNIGTILTAMIGGYLPCIVVGFFYNKIQGFNNSITTYYCFISVLIALSAAYFDEKGYLRRFPHILIAIFTFSVFGGFIGSFLTWFLYGFGFGWGISVDFCNRISETLGLDIFTSDMLANFLIDVADKAMTAFLTVLLYYAMPKKLIELFYPIKNQVSLIKKDQTKPSEYKLSLRTKVMLLVGTATTLVAISAMVIGILQYHNSTVNEYTLTGQAITKTIAEELTQTG